MYWSTIQQRKTQFSVSSDHIRELLMTAEEQEEYFWEPVWLLYADLRVVSI
jgi:hypothetical protein